MLPDKWQEISKIFNVALEKEAGERPAFLDEACAGDAKLRRELEALISASEERDSFMDSPKALIKLVADSAPRLKEGQVVASFEVARLLGSGGMGEVYLARDLRLDRQVALKILPSGSKSDQNAVRRFLREAQSAASLEHPNICTIHEIGEEDGLSFIVMQYIEGKTLSELISMKNLSPRISLEIAIQIADALSEAHARGIIHRDIKPANVIISPNHQAKVLDFGLAKKTSLASGPGEASLKTKLSHPGLIMGTASYMSPEQVKGIDVDLRSDLWSLGVVLYEMLCGTTPFPGESSVEKLASILYHQPAGIDLIQPELQPVLKKALSKGPSERYQSAAEMISDLKRVKEDIEFAEQLKIHITSSTSSGSLNEKINQYLAENSSIENLSLPGNQNRPYWWRPTLLGALMIAALSAAAFLGYRYYQRQNALADIKKASDLAVLERNFEAYDIAVRAGQVVPGNPELEALMPTISDTLSVESEPSAAKAYLRRYSPEKDAAPEKNFIGETPITGLRIARGDYILRIEKEGYEPFERSISGTIPRIGGSFIASPPLKVQARLWEVEASVRGMVFVPEGKYNLVNWARPTEKEVTLGAFFIDKYEVSNREFKEFVSAGGYLKKELWKFPVYKNGALATWEQAMLDFKDKTGLNSPRSWSNQDFPAGSDNHPVTDITWYEAAAYAEFRGKSLPTVFQWEKAARDGAWDARYNAMPWGFIRQGETTANRANFRGTGTLPVSSNEFGMSPFGAYNMAGNVSEWCFNQSPDGFVTAGGAWNDLLYSFGDYGEYPGYYAADRIGFRLVKNIGEVDPEKGWQMLPPAKAPEFRPVSDGEFRAFLSHYNYDPLESAAEIVETIEAADWIRQRILFQSRKNQKAIAYLYLPRNTAAPYQVLHYVPPGDVVRGIRSLPDSIEMFMAPFIKSGRAVFGVVLEGYPERPFPQDYIPPANSSVGFRRQMVDWVTDIRQGLDYLASRGDIEKSRIAFLGISNGANFGMLLSAIEMRYSSLAFISPGFDKEIQSRIAEANPINFAPRIKTPKIVISGRYDETFPYSTDVKPLLDILREPLKKLPYEGGHVPNPEFYSPAINSWLDETLGPVNR